MANWRILKTKEDYDRAMERLLQLADTDLEEGTDEMDEFELISLLIGHYEESNFSMSKPDPIEAIKFRMDQQGLTQADMTQFIGSSSKVSEVLNRKRPLSLSMIRRLHNGLGIPADILIRDVNELEWEHVFAGDESTKTIGIAISSFELSNSALVFFQDRVAEFQPIEKKEEIKFSKSIGKEPQKRERSSFRRVTKMLGAMISTASQPEETHSFEEGFNLIS